MSAKVLESEKSIVKLELTISPEDFTAALNQVYQQNKKHFTIQGFRKGKAPRKLIEAHYGKGIFVEEAIDLSFPPAYRAALDETQIQAVTAPELEKVEKCSEEEGAVFIVKVGVKPEVKLGEYKGAEIGALTYEATEEDIDARLKQMQNQNSRIISQEDTPAKSGDTVNIDYKGFVDDEAFIGGEDTGYSLELGSNTFIPGFEDQLIGAKAGDDVEVKVTFPEEYHAENLKGKDAVFKVKVNEVQTKELPELDDDFAMDVSEFDTLEELKGDLKGQIEKERTRNLRQDAERIVIEYATDNAEVDVPYLMVDEEIDRQMESFEKQMKTQGLTLEQYFQYSGTTKEAFVTELRPDAEKNIKVELVLAEIADQEQLEATEEDMDAEIKQYADAFNHDFESYKKTVDDRMRTYLDSNIRRRKTVDLLVESAVQK